GFCTMNPHESEFRSVERYRILVFRCEYESNCGGEQHARHHNHITKRKKRNARRDIQPPYLSRCYTVPGQAACPLVPILAPGPFDSRSRSKVSQAKHGPEISKAPPSANLAADLRQCVPTNAINSLPPLVHNPSPKRRRTVETEEGHWAVTAGAPPITESRHR